MLTLCVLNVGNNYNFKHSYFLLYVININNIVFYDIFTVMLLIIFITDY